MCPSPTEAASLRQPSFLNTLSAGSAVQSLGHQETNKQTKKEARKTRRCFSAAGTGDSQGACAASGLPAACLRPTWQKAWRPPPPFLQHGAELPGTARQLPRNRKWSLGSLTLGTKSNLDLEPGEEWHREVARWGGMPREAGVSVLRPWCGCGGKGGAWRRGPGRDPRPPHP